MYCEGKPKNHIPYTYKISRDVNFTVLQVICHSRNLNPQNFIKQL